MSARRFAKRGLQAAGVRRSTVAAARMCCERGVLSRLGPRSAQRSRILCYHSIGTPQWGVNDVSPGQFRRHLEIASELGYRFVPSSVIAAGAAGDRDLAITFDDGLTSVATNGAPILKEFGVPYAVFVVSDWAAGHHTFDADLLMDWRSI